VLNREPCENQGRARRCNRGRNPRYATDHFLSDREGVEIRLIRKSEDLPEDQATPSTDRGLLKNKDQRIKKGHPWIEKCRSGDFFLILIIKQKEGMT